MRRLRDWRLWLAALAALGLVMWGAAEWLLRSDWLEQRLRDEVRVRLEQALGGEVEIGEVELDRATFVVTLRNVTARAAPGAEPFLRLPEARIGLRVESLWRAEASLASIVLERPEIRIESGPDGILNLPPRAEGGTDPFELGAGLIEALDATFHWNDESRRLSLVAEDVDLTAQAGGEGCMELTLTAASSAAAAGETRFRVDSTNAKGRVCADRVELDETAFGLNGAEARVTGLVRGFTDPHAELQVSVQGPFQAFEPFLTESALPQGRFTFDGSADWRPFAGRIEYEGAVSAADLRLSAFERDAPPGTLRARVAGNETRLRLEGIEAGVFGGQFRGSAEVEEPFGRPSGSLEGEVEGFRLTSLLESVAGRGGPDWRAVPWTAAVRARIKAEASADGELTSEVAVELEGTGERPLTGEVRGRYRSRTGALDLDALELTTDATRLAADGSWAAGGTDLRLRWVSDDDRDLLPALAMIGVDLDELPVEMLGRVSLQGELHGRIAPVQSRDFAFEGHLSTGAIRLLNYEWTSLDAELLLRQDLLRIGNAMLRDGPGTAELTIEAELEPGVPLAQRPLLGWVRARSLPAEKALAAGRLPALLSGLTDADATISGPAANPDLSASATVRAGALAGRKFDSLTLEADSAGDTVRLSRLELRSGPGRLTGAGSYDRANGALEVTIRGADWGVAQLVEALEKDWPATGEANLDLHVQATVRPGQRPVERLRAEGEWSVATLRWSGQDFGDLRGAITTDGDTVTIDWNGAPLGGTLTGKASLRLDADEVSGSAQLAGADAGQVLRLAGVSVERVSGQLSGGFSFQGDPANMAEVELEGSIDKAELSISELPGAGTGYALYNPFPMRWAIRNRTLELEHMRLQGLGTDFEVDGDISLTGDQPVDLVAEGVLNLAVLESFRSELEADGSAVINAAVRGTAANPHVTGRLRIENGSVRSVDFPNGLSALNGQVTFEGREVRLEELSALSGGGRLTLSGTASFADDAPEYRFNVDVDRVRLRYPANISSLIDGEIILSGANNRGLLAGEVIVRRAATNSQISLGALLAALREPTQTPARAPWLDEVQLNLHVASGPDFELETSLLRNVEADLDLRLVGTAVSPSVLGRMNINQGQMNFHGSRYTINRGEISFVNPFRVEPVLDFELETRIRGIDIGLILSGPTRRLNMSYRSDPPLSISDLVNLVAVGRSPTTDPVLASQQRVQQQSLFQTGANTVFEQAIERPVSPGLQRFFGVSRLKVDPQAGGAEANPAARISTEQQITNEVTLIYTYDLSSAQQQTFRLEYTPDRRWTLVLTRDQNGLVGSDVLYKARLP